MTRKTYSSIPNFYILAGNRNLPNMKTYLPKVILSVLVLFFLITSPLFCQWDYWSNPVAITDSLSDNTNPVIRYVSLEEPGYYIFWEKSPDTLSTAIYYKNFYQTDEPHIFMTTNGVHYTNPQLIETSYYQSGDTLFYVFYESDEEGYNNIFYRVYNENGFTEPRALTESTEEKTNLLCNNFGRIVWMEQNRIMHAKLNIYTHIIEEVVVIDSGNCTFPSVIQADDDWMGYDVPAVAWIKEVNDSSRIMVRKYNQQNGWLEPEVLFTGSQCLNLSFCTGIGPPEILSWDYFNDTSWHVVHYDLQDNLTYIPEFDRNEPFYPKFYSGIIPVTRWFDVGICSIVYTHADSTDIYTSPFYYGVWALFEDYQNVSKSDNLVRYPKIISGKVIGCNQYFINIWEEQVNNHWQLKYVTAHECLSMVEEKNLPSLLDLRINPNPVSEETNISFLLDRPSDVVLSIRDLSGKLVSTVASGKLNAGQYVYEWNGASLPPGIYIVILQNCSVVTTKKLILSK